MTPTYACKGARRYRYYVSRRYRGDPSSSQRPIIRVRADAVEQQVMLATGHLLPHNRPATIMNNDLCKASARQLIEASVERIELTERHLRIALTSQTASNSNGENISIEGKPVTGRVGRAIMANPNENGEPAIRLDMKARASLVRAIARSRFWVDDILASGHDLEAIAAKEKRNVRSVQLMLSLAFLAPEIVTAAADRTLPAGVGQRLLSDVPMLWEEQRAMFKGCRVF